MILGIVIIAVLGLIGSLVSPSNGSTDTWVDRSGGHRF